MANAPTYDTPFLYKEQPYRPVVHAVKSVALSKLFSPLKALTTDGVERLLLRMQKYSLSVLLGELADEFLYGDIRVPNPYYRPFSPAEPLPPPNTDK